MLRQQLLRAAKRAQQEEQAWRARVSRAARWGAVRVRLERRVGLQEHSRRQLATAAALHTRELRRLGRLQALLLRRTDALAADAIAANATLPDGRPEGASWAVEAQAWSGAARRLVTEVLGGKGDGESDGIGQPAASGVEVGVEDDAAMVELMRLWAHRGDCAGWAAALVQIDSRRRLRGARAAPSSGMASTRAARASNVLSSLLTPTSALALHHAVAPRWPVLASAGATAANLGREIWLRRFWTPFR